MGVPAFFKWLSVRYPQCVVDALNPQQLNRMFEEYQHELAAAG